MSYLRTGRLLDGETMVRLSRFRFVARHAVEGPFPGRHGSRRPGGSVEFAEYRQYTPGEDLRRLDWKVMARIGRAYVRRFQEDTQLACTIVVDTSASMRFPADEPGTKLEHAMRLASGLAYVVHRGGDRAGLALVADRLADWLSPAATPSHLQLLLDRLESAGSGAGQRTCLGAALEQLVPTVAGRGVLVILSDFLDDDPDRLARALRLFRHRRFEVLLLQIIHPDEQHLREGHSYRYRGLEGEPEVVSCPREIAEAYADRFESFAQSVRTLAHVCGCGYRRVSTAASHLETLETLLVERSG